MDKMTKKETLEENFLNDRRMMTKLRKHVLNLWTYLFYLILEYHAKLLHRTIIRVVLLYISKTTGLNSTILEAI